MNKNIEELAQKLLKRGYFFNPDASMAEALLESLYINQQRYGYAFCPCRLATGDYLQDRDLICPCDYRDQDINEYETCYCGLYTSQQVVLGKKMVAPIPERRETVPAENKIWRCKVCGYICARPHPPDICPICGVTYDRFEEFSFENHVFLTKEEKRPT